MICFVLLLLLPILLVSFAFGRAVRNLVGGLLEFWEQLPLKPRL